MATAKSRFMLFKKYQQWKVHSLSTVLGAYDLSRKRFRRYYVRPVNLHRNEKGEFASLLQEIREKDPERHFTYFRMSKERYDHLLSLVKNDLQHQKTHLMPIGPSQRLAVALRLLATGDSYATVAASFRLGKATVCRIFHETCEVLYKVLQPVYLPSPTQEDFEKSSKDFERFWHFPNCIGALDGKHVTCQAPPNSGSQHFNYKSTFSVILMALVDARYCFTVIDVGAYGKQSDGGSFSGSEMGRQLGDGTLKTPQESKLPGSNNVVPHVIVADEAFPLKPYIMRPYSNKNLSRKEKIFNYRLSRARRIVENAFGILAQRWRIFRRIIIASAEQIDRIIMAAVVLHNFLRRGDDAVYPSERYLPPSWRQEDDADSVWNWEIEEDVLRDSTWGAIQSFSDRRATAESFRIRDVFADYFSSENGKVPWQDAAVDRGSRPLKT